MTYVISFYCLISGSANITGIMMTGLKYHKKSRKGNIFPIRAKLQHEFQGHLCKKNLRNVDLMFDVIRD